ncbi:MAG: acylphosphatase [Candidatus Parcubacteria bacterium]|jgi:acylphosphatase|nr:acylphosphatase [Candidatus Parcubacteria bacterium]
MERLEAVVSGKVQGVWFRDFVTRQAKALDLAGTAQNLPDGTVHVIAEGPREKLDLLIEHLKEGPELANVTDVTHSCVPSEGDYDDFRII